MQQNENTPWQYKPDGGTPVPAEEKERSDDLPKRQQLKNISWEAVEFLEHNHTPFWYLSLTVITILVAAAVYLLAKDIFAAAIIMVVGAIVWVFAGQKPGKASYEITLSGLSINGKIYSFANYKSFTVIREGGLSSVNLTPLKKLTPPLTAYFDSKDEQKIIEAIGEYLPYDNRKLDSIDRLSRRLHL